MADRTVEIEPPSSDFEQVGWHCHYHLGYCRNALDCDLSPTFRLTDEAFHRILRERDS